MHLQVAPIQDLDDGTAARDLGQAPAEIVILSAADSELAGLAAILADRPAGAPGVALTNFLQLGHPMSVDLYADRTLAKARFVLLRLLGGSGYWAYGIETLRRVALQRRIPFACLPGDTRWDPDFAARGTLPEAEARALWRYFAEGGPDNMRAALAALDHALGEGPPPEPARPVPSAGFWPGPVPADDRPRAAILFYRALVQGGMTEPVAALAAALERRGIAAQPIFVTSLKDESSAATLRSCFAAAPPDIVLNATAFAVGTPAGASRHSGAAQRNPEPMEAGQAGSDPQGVQAVGSGFSLREPRNDGSSAIPGAPDCPVLQVAFAATSEAAWRASPRGLSPRDLAMHVVLPEVDGRIFAGAVAFKEPAPDGVARAIVSRSVPDRIEAAADLAAAWVRLRRTPAAERRVALVVANYPNRDGRLANGVGLDTPASCAVLMEALREAGYRLDGAPADGPALMALLTAGPTNALVGRSTRQGGVRWPVEAYRAAYATLPAETRAAVEARWGDPEADPHVEAGDFRLALHRFGNLVLGVQPARGYNIDPKETYHAPDLAPPHHYLAVYLWLRQGFDAHAVVHVGKHGNLEWLPGKSTGLSAGCFPQAILGALPNIYPFIVNDPGEGMQAKRRSAAVIVDHLTPPLARAELHGDLVQLERLVDEYALAADLDPGRAAAIGRDILASASALRLDEDLGGDAAGSDEMLRRLDAHLCDLKEMQIRDGLHVLGRSPEGTLLDDLLVALARLPRSELRPENASLQRALAADFGLDGFDPLGRDIAAPWTGRRPALLAGVSEEPWRTAGDTVERIEMLATKLVRDVANPFAAAGREPSPRWGEGRVRGTTPSEEGAPPSPGAPRGGVPERRHAEEAGGAGCLEARADDGVHASRRACGAPQQDAVSGMSWTHTRPVLDWIASDLRPRVARSGAAETAACLTALDGRFVAPGPSGAPTRGRPDVLPTGRNFFAVDVRAVPSEAAWRTGRAAAERLVERYWQEEGEWPRAIALSCWGTANMRTGGDDIAQAMALVGARPVWEPESGRVTGFQVIGLSELMRPRVDVTLRVSGLFRDAFPVQIDLFDSAIRAIAALDEPESDNPIAACIRVDAASLASTGTGPEAAFRQASARVFGSKPGAYGAGLQALIDEGGWGNRGDFAAAYLAWGGFAYGAGREGEEAGERLSANLARVDAVVQAQDNREHDVLDSDDYYQFMGGLSATVETLSGRAPPVFHLDTSRPEAPLARTLTEEVARVVRGRAANPKWIAGVMRHGYKGAFEIAATVDYLFGFAATTNAVRHHQFDQLFAAYLEDERVRDFMEEANPAALRETAGRFAEAIRRGLWQPRSNRAAEVLSDLVSEADPIMVSSANLAPTLASTHAASGPYTGDTEAIGPA
ncbi:cobaltochelatase subunit CobN [uncultured Enterovirga sp.]|uniref:cobaltochelatase subunit CobN n=1 Tax=uncultured Enterovirga sp. TaxID=2026352 RepID=UPI0035CA080A